MLQQFKISVFNMHKLSVDIILLKFREKPIPVFICKSWILFKFFLHHENLREMENNPQERERKSRVRKVMLTDFQVKRETTTCQVLKRGQYDEGKNFKHQPMTLIWYTGCILFCMQSSTILLTCFKPLNEPIAATVLPYSITKSDLAFHFIYCNPKKKNKAIQSQISKNSNYYLN